MAKIVIFEDGEEPVIIESEEYVVATGEQDIFTNHSRDGLIVSLAKLTFLAFMNSMNGEGPPDDRVSPE